MENRLALSRRAKNDREGKEQSEDNQARKGIAEKDWKGTNWAQKDHKTIRKTMDDKEEDYHDISQQENGKQDARG